jgi:hypothetical protein
MAATLLPWTEGPDRASDGRRDYTGWDLFDEFGAIWTFQVEGWEDSTGDLPTAPWLLAAGAGMTALGLALTVGARPGRGLTVAVAAFGVWCVTTTAVIAGPYMDDHLTYALRAALVAGWLGLALLAWRQRSWLVLALSPLGAFVGGVLALVVVEDLV